MPRVQANALGVMQQPLHGMTPLSLQRMGRVTGPHLGEELNGSAESRGARQKQDPLGSVPAKQGPEELGALGGGVFQRMGLVTDDHAEVALVAAQLLREVV